MNLTWHIARKDLRRFALPVAVWVALIMGPLVAFRLFSPQIEGHMASSLEGSLRILGIWVGLLMVGQLLIGYALAGALVLEDPWRGSNAFWKTRPVGKRRLMTAKLAGAAVAFLVVPVMALAAVWFASGFDGREAAAGAWTFVKVQGVATLVAFVLALAARHLSRMFFLTIIVGAAGAVVAPTIYRWLEPRAMLASVGRVEERAEDRAAEIVADATFTKLSANSVPTLFISAPWNGDRGYVPMLARLTDGSVARGGTGAGAVQAGLRTLGMNDETGALRWQIHVPSVFRVPEEELRATGVLEVWAGRMRVLGESPIRVGGEIVEGAVRTRVVGLERVDGYLNAIYVEERDAASAADGLWDSARPLRKVEAMRYIDSYYLVNRRTGKASWLSPSTTGTIEMHSLAARYRRLGVPGTQDWNEGVLVKLRFERERRIERPLDVRGVTATPGRKAR